MKLLIYDMGSYTVQDLIYYLKNAGHSCRLVVYHFADKFTDPFFVKRFAQHLEEESYQAVISINFFPLVAQICKEYYIPYISWCYDSPIEEQLIPYFSYETNFIYLFDRIEVSQYQEMGYSNIYHLPLAVNTNRLDTITITKQENRKYQCDISFVGKIYESPLETLLMMADPFTKGYIEGILQAQLRIYGYYFIEDLITEEVLDQINQSFRKIGQNKISLNQRGLSFAVSTQITQFERSFLLNELAQHLDTRFYTTQSVLLDHKVKIQGPVTYFQEMPIVFRCSKLNLNPTLKCIQSGIPLRALDVMGSKGVLLSNYQPELAEVFENEREVLWYDSLEDAVEKAQFYVKKDTLLNKIAENGYQKVKKQFSYQDRISVLLSKVLERPI